MPYCTRCGTAAGAEQAFCNHCGSQLRPLAEPRASAAAPPLGAGPDPWPAQPGPSAPAANWMDRDLGPGAETATWAPQESVDAGAPPDTSRPPLVPAGAGAGSTSGRPSPSGRAGYAGPPANLRPSHRRRGGRIGAVIALAVIVFASGGGVAAWRLFGHKAERHTGDPHRSAGTVRPRSSSTGTATPSGAPPASPASSAPNTGPGAVAIAPTVSQQATAPQVAAFLRSYFLAINTRDYSQYSSLFAPRLRPTLKQFESGYRSTRDSGAELTGISPTPVGVAAAVSFTSHQQPTDSPTGTSCTSWDVTLYLRPYGTTYRIVSSPAGYHAHYQAC